MDEPPPRRYVPVDVRFATSGEQRIESPRDGFGTVYVQLGRNISFDLAWVATWLDPFPEQGDEPQVVGMETFEGSRDAVLAWARSRPAERVLVPTADDPYWIPLPERDEDVDLDEEGVKRRLPPGPHHT